MRQRFVLQDLALGGVYLSVLSLGLPLAPAFFLLPLAAGSGLLLYVGTPLQGRQDRWLWAALGIFLAVSLLSSALAAAPRRAFLVDLTLIPGLLLGAVIAFYLSREQIGRLIAALVAAAVTLSAFLLAIAFQHPTLDPSQWLRLAGYPFFGVPNDLLLLALLFPFPLLHLVAGNDRRLAFASLLALVLLASCLAVYHSRSGVLIAGLILMVGALVWRGRLIAWTLVALVLGTVLADYLSGFGLAGKFLALDTLSSRLPMWMVAWEMFLDAPWLGHGPGAYSLNYDHYRGSLSVPDWVVVDDRHVPWAHNIYLEMLAERGIVGAVALGVVVYRVFHRIIGHFPCPGGSCGGLVAAAGALLATLLAGVGELSFSRLWVVVWIFSLMAICLALSAERGGVK